jgi:ATP-dependent helicase/DNAse subunit B
MRRGRQHDVEPDDSLVERRILEASSRIAAGDFALGPQHAQRPCKLCAFRPICTDARKVL